MAKKNYGGGVLGWLSDDRTPDLNAEDARDFAEERKENSQIKAKVFLCVLCVNLRALCG